VNTYFTAHGDDHRLSALRLITFFEVCHQIRRHLLDTRISSHDLLQRCPAAFQLRLLIFFLIFGVIAVSEFKGKFYFCSEDLPTETTVNSKWDCLNAGGIWDNQVYTFDDIPNAMITLFVMVTTAGWQDVLMNSITSTSIDYVP
jgi:hypothetical protein